MGTKYFHKYKQCSCYTVLKCTNFQQHVGEMITLITIMVTSHTGNHAKLTLTFWAGEASAWFHLVLVGGSLRALRLWRFTVVHLLLQTPTGTPPPHVQVAVTAVARALCSCRIWTTHTLEMAVRPHDAYRHDNMWCTEALLFQGDSLTSFFFFKHNLFQIKYFSLCYHHIMPYLKENKINQIIDTLKTSSKLK